MIKYIKLRFKGIILSPIYVKIVHCCKPSRRCRFRV